MFRKFMRQTRRFAPPLAAALLTSAARAQVNYAFTFPAATMTTTVLKWDGSTAPTGGDPIFHRPVIAANSAAAPTALNNSTGSSYVPYRTQNFTLAATNVYTIAVSGTLTPSGAALGLIYKDSFDPNNPLTNVVVGISGSVTTTLAAGNYVFVALSSVSGGSGAVTATITATPTLSAISSATGTTAAPGSSPIFNKPYSNGNLPPTLASGASGGSYFYNVSPFTVPTDGQYQLFSDTTANLWYDQICLYQNNFDPANPLTNCLLVSGPSVNYPDPTYTSNLITNLTAGTQYYFVTCGYNPTNSGTLGSYANTVSPVTVPTLDSWTGTTVGGPTFDRPVQPTGTGIATLKPTALYNGSPATSLIAYDKHDYTPVADGVVTITSVCVSPASWNNYLLIYDNGFDPANPLTNCIAAADGGYSSDVAPTVYVTQGTFNSIVKVTLKLTGGHTYTIVTTGNLPSNTGTYAGSITTSPIAGTPVASFNGSLTAGSGGLSYNRPNAGATPTTVPTTISSTAIPYSVNSFTVTTDANYKISTAATQPAQWGLYLILYKTKFTASTPLVNALGAVGSDNGTNQTATIPQIHLTPGTYYAVTSGLGPLAEGGYQLTAQQYLDNGIVNYTYSGGSLNGGTGATFTRPALGFPPAALSTNTGVYYDAHPFTVPATGLYNFDAVSDPTIPWDDFVSLYQTSFTASSPLSNIVITNDSARVLGTDAGLRNIQLTAGTQYVMVTSGTASTQFGAYQATLYTGVADFPPVIPDGIGATGGLTATLTVPDGFTIASLNSVTVTGLTHPRSGELLATLSHGGTTIELFDRINRTTTSSAGALASFNGQDYTLKPSSAGGADLSAAAATASSGPIPSNVAYAPYLNGTTAQSSTLTGDFTAFNGQSVSGDWKLTLSDFTASNRGTFTGFKFSVTPVLSAITGSVALEQVPDLSAISAAAPLGTFHIALRQNGTQVAAYDVPLTVPTGSPTGTYTLTGVTTGTYDILIKGDKNLAALAPGVVVGSATATAPGVTLLAGDANNDNFCDATDFGLLVGAYGGDASMSGSGYDPTADFNYDGFVNTTDFGLLVDNYGANGAG